MHDPDFITLTDNTGYSIGGSINNRGRKNIRSVSTNPTKRNINYSSNTKNDQPTHSSNSNSMNRSFFTNSGFMYGPPVCGSGGSVASLSPFHVATKAGVNNVVAVGTKTKSLSLLIDRSGDYNYNPKRMGIGNVPGGSTSRDQSLDRQLNYSQNDKKRDYYMMGNRWERASADRDYTYPPNLGTGAARSLERENQIRTQSFDGVGSFLRGDNDGDDDNMESPSPTTFYPNNDSSISCRDGFVLDLQAQIADLNKECAILQQDLDLAKDKLNSTMNSIKSFWSPELKKERTLRKEENLKYVALNEQLKAAEIENRQHLTSLMKLEQENRFLKESNATTIAATNLPPSTGTGVILGDPMTSSPQLPIPTSSSSSPSASLEMVKKERDKFAREAKLLRKTLQEMEMRIETQQKTMTTRDSTIQKLMDLLQQQQQQQQQQQLSSNFGVAESVSPSKKTSMDDREETLQNVLQQKSNEISRMSQDSEASKQTIENLRCQEKALKDKLESLRSDLKRLETENGGLKTRVDILQKHLDDRDRHVGMLREQLSSKEQQAKLLQGDIEMLRGKLDEKDDQLTRKSKQLIQLQADKSAAANQLTESMDKFDALTNKFNAQLRKIVSLEETIKEKDLLINSTRLQLDSVKYDRNSTDNALVSLQEVLQDKDRQLERLKEQRERAQKELEELMTSSSERSNEVKAKVNQLQKEVTSKQEVELELRNEVGRLKSEISTKDALVNKLESKINETETRLKESQQKLIKTAEDLTTSTNDNDSIQRQHAIELENSKQEISRLKFEIDRSIEELAEKKAKISKLEQELAVLSKNRRREGGGGGGVVVDGGGGDGDSGDLDGVDDVAVFKSILSEKDGRIDELEGAMRESIKITAQREVVMAEQQMKMEHTERLMETMQEELETAKKSLEECRQQLTKSDQMLREKEAALREHLNDSKKQLSEVYEMKQEAILAAISEKDAHIALLEMAPNKKTENIDEVERLTKEKAKLQQKLRDLTQSRMKLLQWRGHLRSSSASSLLHYATHRDAIMEKVDFGTYFVYHNELLNVCHAPVPCMWKGEPGPACRNCLQEDDDTLQS